MMSTKESQLKEHEKHYEGGDKQDGNKMPDSSKEAAARSMVQFNFDLDTPSPSSGTLEKYIKNVLGNDSHNAIPDLLKPPGSEHPQDKEAHEQVQQMNAMPQSHHGVPPQMNHGSTTSITTAEPSNNNEVIPVPKGQSYVDISEYLNMPQSEAAKKLGIPPSTLSKRWKEAVRKRKWPYRMICKIDKEIMTLLHNVPQGANAPPLPEEIETALGLLLRKRQEELRAVVIRI